MQKNFKKGKQHMEKNADKTAKSNYCEKLGVI